MAMIFSSISKLSAQAAPITPTLKIGDYIQMGKYNKEPLLWRCVDIDENGPLILTDQAITEKVFDAAGEHKYLDGTKQADNEYDDRTYYGSNVWETSSLRSWLNSISFWKRYGSKSIQGNWKCTGDSNNRTCCGKTFSTN